MFMKDTRTRFWISASLLLVLSGPVSAQDRAQASADGKAFAKEQAQKARSAAMTAPDANRIQGYDANPSAIDDLAESRNDPGSLKSKARAAARVHAGYQAIDTSRQRRARFSEQDIQSALSRSTAISAAPLDYTSGMAIGGAKGRCVPLPGGSTSAGRYTATCNTGIALEDRTRQCRVNLEVRVRQQKTYKYLCTQVGEFGFGDEEDCSVFDRQSCRVSGHRPGRCLQWGGNRQGTKWCVEPGESLTEMSCDAPVDGQLPFAVSSHNVITETRDERACQADIDAGCRMINESCTDSDPVTRLIDGVPVTRPCWAWERDYHCSGRREASDCGELASNPSCALVRTDCISEDTPCTTFEKVYDCPLPLSEEAGNQFICDGDVYCIDGSCETIEREANDEFRDAAVALHAMNEAKGQFDPDTLTLFKGARATCSSKVFGVLNCCRGKGFPLVPGIGVLIALGCDREELSLHERDAKGLCAYVGSYCAKKILGICTTKRKAYCCFESRLSRILQEQGRAQLPKPWTKAKAETCEGFTVAEFARLDLSRMNFAEVYAEFTQAARLPDELKAADDIQQKIKAFYERSGS